MERESEAVEICPFCEGENVFPNYDVTNDGYVVKCQHCGEEMMLCDECLHKDDNKPCVCDWHEEIKSENKIEGHCFRGVTHHRR